MKPTGSPIQQTPSGEFDLAGVESIQQTRSGESGSMEPGRSILEDLERATTPGDEPREFLPQLGWGHYQELMRVENRNERHFYEIEAAKEGWDLPHAPTGGPQFCFQPSLWPRLSSAPASVHADPVGSPVSPAFKHCHPASFNSVRNRSWVMAWPSDACWVENPTPVAPPSMRPAIGETAGLAEAVTEGIVDQSVTRESKGASSCGRNRSAGQAVELETFVA